MKKRTPIQHPISFWNKHVQAWRSSELTQSEYCRINNIRIKAFGCHKIRICGADNQRDAKMEKLDLVALPLISPLTKDQIIPVSSGISISIGSKVRVNIDPTFDFRCLTAVLKVVTGL